jgi:hypothetical protein
MSNRVKISELWLNQDQRVIKYGVDNTHFQEVKEQIESSVSTLIPNSFECEALYISPHAWLREDGFNGWIVRIVPLVGQAFYDLSMDRITSQNLTHYVNNAIELIKFNGGNIIKGEFYELI